MATQEDLLSEIHQLTLKLDEARSEIVTRNVLDETLLQVRQSFRRYLAPLVPLAVLAALVVGVGFWSTNRTTSRIESCTTRSGACYKALAVAGEARLTGLLTYLDCVLTHPIPERTEAVKAECRARAFPGRD